MAGRTNVLADALSQNPIAALPMVDEEQAVECTICFILKGAPLSLEMVVHETAKDTVLLQVIQEIQTFWKLLLVRQSYRHITQCVMN